MWRHCSPRVKTETCIIAQGGAEGNNACWGLHPRAPVTSPGVFFYIATHHIWCSFYYLSNPSSWSPLHGYHVAMTTWKEVRWSSEENWKWTIHARITIVRCHEWKKNESLVPVRRKLKDISQSKIAHPSLYRIHVIQIHTEWTPYRYSGRALKGSILVGGGPIRPPVRSRKPSIRATSGKPRWIGLSKIYNFNKKKIRPGQYWGHQRSSKIRCLGNYNLLYSYLHERSHNM